MLNHSTSPALEKPKPLLSKEEELLLSLIFSLCIPHMGHEEVKALKLVSKDIKKRIDDAQAFLFSPEYYHTILTKGFNKLEGSLTQTTKLLKTSYEKAIPLADIKAYSHSLPGKECGDWENFRENLAIRQARFNLSTRLAILLILAASGVGSLLKISMRDDISMAVNVLTAAACVFSMLVIISLGMSFTKGSKIAHEGSFFDEHENCCMSCLDSVMWGMLVGGGKIFPWEDFLLKREDRHRALYLPNWPDKDAAGQLKNLITLIEKLKETTQNFIKKLAYDANNITKEELFDISELDFIDKTPAKIESIKENLQAMQQIFEDFLSLLKTGNVPNSASTDNKEHVVEIVEATEGTPLLQGNNQPKEKLHFSSLGEFGLFKTKVEDTKSKFGTLKNTITQQFSDVQFQDKEGEGQDQKYARSLTL